MIFTNLKPTKDKINTFLTLGSFFVIFAFLDVLTNTFLITTSLVFYLKQ